MVTGANCWRQYRYAIDQYIFEAPGGTMEPSEDPIETARRELIEETGFTAQTFVSKGFIYTTPGDTDEKIFLSKPGICHHLTSTAKMMTK